MGMWWRRAGEGARASGSACPRIGGGFFFSFLFSFPFLSSFLFSFFKINPAGLTFGFWCNRGREKETTPPVKADFFFFLIPGMSGRWLNPAQVGPSSKHRSLLGLPGPSTIRTLAWSHRPQECLHSRGQGSASPRVTCLVPSCPLPCGSDLRDMVLHLWLSIYQLSFLSPLAILCNGAPIRMKIRNS